MKRKALYRACAALIVLVVGAGPAEAKPPRLTLEDVRAGAAEAWRGVRDIAVQDRVTIIEYKRVAVLSVPKTYKAPIALNPNRWMAAPGLEYLELWQGDKSVVTVFDGSVTRQQGRRNAFKELKGKVRPGNQVPMDDISFAYYLGRMGRAAGLVDFLEMPDTRLVDDRKTVNEIPCVRVAGVVDMDLDGTKRECAVTLDLSPGHGWLPVRSRFVDAATGLAIREYKVRSFFVSDGFPFPREAQIDLYDVVPAKDATRRDHAVLKSSLVLTVEGVAVNQGLGPEHFAFEFAPGVEVTDEAGGRVYRTPGAPEPVE